MFGAEQISILFGVGLVAGFFAGLLGIGGGLFYILAFSIFLAPTQNLESHELIKLVIANSILATFFAALSASIKQWKINNFYPKQVLYIGLFGFVASVLVTYLLSLTKQYDRGVFAAVLTLALIPIIAKMLKQVNPSNQKSVSEIAQKKYHALGLLSGTATALSGLGGGFVMVPILNSLFKVAIHKATSLSIGVIVIVSGATSIYNLFFASTTYNFGANSVGTIIFPLVLPVVIGVMLAAPMGVKAANRIPAKLVRNTFVLFCVFIVIRNIKEILTTWNIL